MRHNVLNKIQQPLRLALLSTCIYLSGEEEMEAVEGALAIKKVNDVIRVFKAQVKYEGMYLLPLVFENEPSVWNAYTREHHKAMNLARDLEELLQKYPGMKAANQQGEWLKQLGETFNEFMMFNYRHMDDEEEVLNEFLWRFYKDDVILQLQEEIEMPARLIKQHQGKKVYEVAA